MIQRRNVLKNKNTWTPNGLSHGVRHFGLVRAAGVSNSLLACYVSCLALTAAAFMFYYLCALSCSVFHKCLGKVWTMLVFRYLTVFDARITLQLWRPSAGGEITARSRGRRPVLAGVCGPVQVVGSQVETAVRPGGKYHIRPRWAACIHTPSSPQCECSCLLCLVAFALNSVCLCPPHKRTWTASRSRWAACWRSYTALMKK